MNPCIDSLADAAQKPRITHLESQVDFWEKCSFVKKSEFVQKAGEACQLVCDVIALRDGKALFQAVVDHYFQDVAYGTHTIKLESVEEFVMPNMVRTVAKCTIINQCMDHCKENGFEPKSKSTMWWVLEVQEANQRKSLRRLDDTAAEGADGFKNFLQIIDELERVGAVKGLV